MVKFFFIPLLLVISGVLFLFSVVMFFSGVWGAIGALTGIANVYGWGFGIALGLPAAVISWGSLWIAWVIFRDEKLVPKEDRAKCLAVYIVIFLTACLAPVVLSVSLGAKKHKAQSSGDGAPLTITTPSEQKIAYV